MSFTLAALTLALFLSPLGQSAVNSWLKNKFINDFDVELSVGALFINPVGITSFTDFLIRDHRNDTLIFVDYFEFESYHFDDLISNSIHLGDVTVDSLFLNLVKYKEEDQSNFDIFIKKVKLYLFDENIEVGLIFFLVFYKVKKQGINGNISQMNTVRNQIVKVIGLKLKIIDKN